jgi:hypothetical protein
MRNRLGILLAITAFIFAPLTSARAEDLFRLFPEMQANGFYGNNIPLRTNNEIGDFGTVLVAGFFLDYTSAARYASLHYDTFAQLFTHQTRFDRAGQGQYVNLTDDENISPTTKVHFDELFYRDTSAVTTVTTSDQSPNFNPALALLLLSNDQASINQFNAQLQHYWGQKWSSEISVHQTTFFATGNKNNINSESFGQFITAATDYHFSSRFALGAGYEYLDFRFTAPGQPGDQVNWPFARGFWQVTRNLYVAGRLGVFISHTQGVSSDQVKPGGTGLIQYEFERGSVNISGGQEPQLTSVFGNVGEVRGFRGNVIYYLTQRLTASGGGSFYNLKGRGFDGDFASWGLGLSDRVNRWLTVSTRFIQIRRTESGSSQFLPSGNENGQWAVGDYYIVGLAISFEAFRWSWR